MTLNFPGPYEVELSYSVDVGGQVLTHKSRLNLDLTADPIVGTPFSGISAKTQSGGTVVLQTAVDAWVVLLRPIFDDTVANFIGANLYKYVPLSDVKDFRSSYTIGLAGTDTGAAVPAHMSALTFHTAEGGEMRLQLHEGNVGFQGKDFLPLANASYQAVVDFVISPVNWILARDTSYPLSFHAWNGGPHRAVFNQRFR